MLKRVRDTRTTLVVVALLALPLAACNGEDSEVTLPEGVTLPEISVPESRPPATEAPTTPAPAPETPATEAPPSSEAEGDGVPVWVWVLLLLVLLGAVAWLAARAGSRSGSQTQQGQQYPPQLEQPPPPSGYEDPPQGT